MTRFDKQEQDIHAAFSQIAVDTESFKSRLDFSATVKKKKPMKFASIAAAVLIFMVVSVTAYATTGGFDFIRSMIDSPFIDYAVEQSKPVYAEDQGIRIEVLAAERVEDIVLLYMTIQDISDNQNLLAPYNWNLSSHSPISARGAQNFVWRTLFEEPLDYNSLILYSINTTFTTNIYNHYAHGSHGGFRDIYFNQETQTLYLEVLFMPIWADNMNWDKALDTDDMFTLMIDWISVSHFYKNENNNLVESYDQMHYQRNIMGDWQLQVSVSDTEYLTIEWQSLSIGNLYFDYIRLSPLGLRGSGVLSGTPNNMHRPLDWIEIEINDSDNIFARPGGGSVPSECDEYLYFDLSWTVQSGGSIDIESVTAIIINGHRI